MPFGESLTLPGDTPKIAKGFTNHEQTDASGLIYMQARFYAPWFGRFLSPDPGLDQHFQDTQSWNIYSYVRNDPTMRIDPTGMVADDKEKSKTPPPPPPPDLKKLPIKGTATVEISAKAPELSVIQGRGSGGDLRNYEIRDLQVFAVRGGRVIQSNNNGTGAKGWTVMIDTEDGFVDYYMHMDPATAAAMEELVGTYINAGDMIGLVGVPTNGSSDSPHTHLQRNIAGTDTTVDPGAASPLSGGTLRQKWGHMRKSKKTGKSRPHGGSDWFPRWSPVK